MTALAINYQPGLCALPRGLFLVATALMTAPALAQTRPTPPSAHEALPSTQSAFHMDALSNCNADSSVSPNSSCFKGNSATGPVEFSSQNRPALSSARRDEEQAKSFIYGRGYLDVSHLTKDQRGIWRGEATLEDGRSEEHTSELQSPVHL